MNVTRIKGADTVTSNNVLDRLELEDAINTREAQGNNDIILVENFKLTGDSFKEYTFHNIHFLNCEMNNLDVYGAHFVECTFENVTSTSLQGTYASFKECTFIQSKFLAPVLNMEARFISCNITGTTFQDGNFELSNFRGCSVEKSDFIACYFRRATIGYVNFRHCVMNMADFVESSIEDVGFGNCVVYDCNFTGADTVKFSLSNTRAMNNNFNEASLIKSFFKGSALDNSTFVNVDMCGHYSSSSFDYTDFTGATYHQKNDGQLKIISSNFKNSKLSSMFLNLDYKQWIEFHGKIITLEDNDKVIVYRVNNEWNILSSIWQGTMDDLMMVASGAQLDVISPEEAHQLTGAVDTIMELEDLDRNITNCSRNI